MKTSENHHAAQGGESSKSAAKTSSTKRKRPANPYGADVVVEPRKCRLDFDIDILDCPICCVRFSSPVYQCRNGHTACGTCCKKFVKKKCPQCELPIGDIRCQAIERILDSMQLSCKYVDYGCKEMLKTEGDLSIHEEHCRLEPFPCPSPECTYKGTNVALPMHLAYKHSVPLLGLTHSWEARFAIEADTEFTLLKGAKEEDPVFLIHREAHSLGDVFFCSALHVPSGVHYSLTVGLSPKSYSMKGEMVTDLRFREREFWKHPFLLLPSCSTSVNRQVIVHFSVYSVDSIVEDSNDN